jgi:hypothetical protein
MVDAGNDVKIGLPQNEVTLNAKGADQDGTIVSYQWTVVSESTVNLASPKSAETKVGGLTAGTYQFVVTVEDNQGATASDTVQVVVEKAPVVDNSKPHLNYAYYEGDWSTLPDFSQLPVVEQGTVASFNLEERKRDDRFAFVFTGYIDIKTAGTYQFYTASDDGSALYIGNQQIVDNDGKHARRERSGTVKLTEGKHPIRVVFFENLGQEVLEVSYQGPGIDKMEIPSEVLSTEGDPKPEAPVAPTTPEAPVAEGGEPGLRYAHYVGEWTSIPDFSKFTAVSEGVVPNFTFAPAGRELYTFGIAYEGYLLVEQAGEYMFQVNANDGSNLYINGKEIVNNDGQKADAQEKSGSISLAAGYHPIRLTFFERWGPQVLEVRYQGPGIKLQPIPDEVLFLNAPQQAPELKNDLVYVNFHREEEGAADGWNNLRTATVTGEELPLQNVNGESTDIVLRLESAWDGANYKGYATGDDSGKYPDAVTRSYFWTKDREVVSLNGLSRDRLYSFTFYASSQFGGDRTTIYTIGDQEVRLNASYNERETVSIENVRPSSNGQIAIEVSRAVGSSYGFLGALIMESKVSVAPVVKQNVVQQEDIVLSLEPEVTDVKVGTQVSVYPNPTIGIVNIKTKQGARYWISDMRGNVVETGETSEGGTTTVDLTYLPKGIYLVKIQTDTEWNTEKIILQ